MLLAAGHTREGTATALSCFGLRTLACRRQTRREERMAMIRTCTMVSASRPMASSLRWLQTSSCDEPYCKCAAYTFPVRKTSEFLFG